MTEPFLVAVDTLSYRHVRERTVKIWREMIRGGIAITPIKVRQNETLPGFWIVISGADAVEAAKREGRSEIECVAV